MAHTRYEHTIILTSNASPAHDIHNGLISFLLFIPKFISQSSTGGVCTIAHYFFSAICKSLVAFHAKSKMYSTTNSHPCYRGSDDLTWVSLKRKSLVSYPKS